MGVAIIVPGVSFADANLGKVNISGDVPVQALRIIAESSYTGTEAQLRVSYLPIATTQRDVTWSIVSGNEYASINASTGVLTIKSGANNSNVVVKVQSTSDSSITAQETIAVTYNSGGETYILKLDNYTVTGSDIRPINLWDDSHKQWTMLFDIEAPTADMNAELLKSVSNGPNNQIEGFQIAYQDVWKLLMQHNTPTDSRGWTDAIKFGETLSRKFCLQRNGNTLSLLASGTEWQPRTNLNYVSDRSNGFVIGGNPGGVCPVGAKLNRLYIFDRLLTVEEAKALY